ncbi:GntR family transcriptional regulator [Desulfatitalea alkaliphila]|uniref:GntR family transcriptional regulator n=1 Tax=Desulfatitalea alkaliphila TaxID=2929485 RepID=A0AA41R457_9BACT|nr:GntR family transcriptional regulator [Desulfatitalea alkaliphila]MCJ8500695.1 GntR family transcriptional regulator [Desulfatitalea alkaliphila]
MEKNSRLPLRERVCRELRQAIVFGSLTPNEHLKEIPLAKHFGCSRGSIREALGLLEQQGFVTHVPNQGATVKEPSAKEVEDYYNLLAVMEGKAVQWATPNLSQGDIDRLKSINDMLKRSLQKSGASVEAWIPLNIEFHRMFREKCGNAKMNWVVEEIRTRITRYRYTSLMVTAFGDYADDHDEIIASIADKDAPKAGKAMENHIQRAKQILVKFLVNDPPANAIFPIG